MDGEFGPLAMRPAERQTFERILTEIYELDPESSGRTFIRGLLTHQTWSGVYEAVRCFVLTLLYSVCMHLFLGSQTRGDVWHGCITDLYGS